MTQTDYNRSIAFGLAFFLLAGVSLSLKAQIFTDQAEEWGVTEITTSQEWGAGLSTYDFNQDGFDDLSLVTDNGNLLFYQNVEGEYFELLDFNISSPDGFTKQILWVDVDNDSNLDIFVSTYFGKVKLYRNTGDFTFIDVTEDVGLPTATAANYGAAFGDYNSDGFLDLHLTRYYLESPPPSNPDISPNLWSRLFKNNGDGTFSDVTYQSGLYFNPVVAFQSVWFDLDNDNDQDNFIIVDRAPGNHLFRNEESIFIDITEEYGVSLPGNDFMSNSVADYNNDGFLDIFMTNSGSIFANTHSVLLRNDEGSDLVDASVSVGLDIYDFGWGATWADVNNDGWKDLYFVTEEDFQHNNLYLNNEGVFIEAHAELNTDSDYPCFAVARGDFNNDGFYDLAVQGRDPFPSQLMINNEFSNNWIKFRLVGTLSNLNAVGSTIYAYVGDDQYMEYTFCGENYISQNSQNQIIGIGNAEMVDSLTVTYLSGHTDTYYNIASNSTYLFTEGETYSVQILASDTAICSGESISLSTESEHETYFWSTGETSSEITVDASGVYTVQTTNPYGITSIDSILINVNPLPEPIQTTSLNPCNGDSLAGIQLTNNAGVDADTVLWSNGLSGLFIDSLPGGVYSYQFIDVNGCSAEGSVEIQDPPVLTAFANSTPSDVDESNGSIQVTIFGGIAPYTILLDGDTVSTEINNLDPGLYSILIIDSYGCEKKIDIAVESTLSNSFESVTDLKIYPLPANREMRITSAESIEKVSIVTLSGITVLKVYNSFDEIDLSQLSPGVYIVIVKFGSSHLIRRRIVKI